MKFREWLIRNQDNITWFVIGSMTYAFVDNLGEGRYGWAFFNAMVIYANVKLRRVRLT